VVERAARNAPKGLGEPVFDKLEADLAKWDDVLTRELRDLKKMGSAIRRGVFLVTGSEHNDGVLSGSISNGEILPPLAIVQEASKGESVTVKISLSAPLLNRPATIGKEQKTMTAAKETTLEAKGRHDPLRLPRASPW
jgi:chorismate synthase